MSRSARLQKKLLSQHLLEVAGDVVSNEPLVKKLWSLRQGDSIDLTAQTLSSYPLERYGLEYSVTWGPIPGHWLYQEFNPAELELFFIAKENESIAHAWLLYVDE